MFCLGGETSSCSGIGNINHRPQANVPDAVPMKRALYSLNPESGGDNINSEAVRIFLCSFSSRHIFENYSGIFILVFFVCLLKDLPTQMKQIKASV